MVFRTKACGYNSFISNNIVSNKIITTIFHIPAGYDVAGG